MTLWLFPIPTDTSLLLARKNCAAKAAAEWREMPERTLGPTLLVPVREMRACPPQKINDVGQNLSVSIQTMFMYVFRRAKDQG